MGKIVWLASYPKSGNTWMRALLHNLFRNPDRPLPLNELGGGQLTTAEAALHWYQGLDPRPLAEIPQEELDALRLRVHAAIAASLPGNIFCKIHGAIFELRGTMTVNLDVSAGAIYIVRNPLDVVLSYADFQGISVDVATKGLGARNFELPRDSDNVSEPLGSWSQNVESWTGQPSPALHVVRYEDLIAKPVAAFGKVAKFLGIDAPRPRLERAVRFSSFKVLRGQEDRSGFAERSPAQERFFRSGRAGGWRDALSDEQVTAIVSDHREQMVRFNYVPDGF
ncbi:MAG: sulfotransferase domain-containing protein [Rhodospirillaceae bacterium]|nr:sulfotransferase domain-containing protein [Rhodospirillaceae bacterium]MBT6510151.1 sulfotransferase domain-containing protein [Rhodospirillaceae bacterium]MBT7614433.1 sulfotransferase domain-containing protein [Rhodospirillaceae bacterium]MBT7648347.1 sulfotransferase domain-containing protein [Rhodospirillaceae bacterium]